MSRTGSNPSPSSDMWHTFGVSEPEFSPTAKGINLTGYESFKEEKVWEFPFTKQFQVGIVPRHLPLLLAV